VIGCSDAIVISVTLSTSAVAPFYLASRVVRCFARFFLPVGAVLFPMLTHFEAIGNQEKVRRLCLRGTRLLWILTLGIGMIGFCFAPDFFALWIGHQTDALEGRVSDLFNVLLVGAMVTAPQQIALPAFLALGRQRLVAALFVLEAAATVGLSLALVGRFGLMGIAWGMCLPSLAFQGIVHPLVTCTILDVGVGTYVKEVLVRPFALAAVLIPVASMRPAVPIGSWLTLLLAGAVSSLVVLAATAGVALDREDRERFIVAPIRKLRTNLLRTRRPAAQDAEVGS
jgi:O-antigen/teichoic acid export membrane protein